MNNLSNHLEGKETYTPKVYTLKKPFPGCEVGSRFQQSRKSKEIYFCAIPLCLDLPEENQVSTVEVKAMDVENNPEWFQPVITNRLCCFLFCTRPATFEMYFEGDDKTPDDYTESCDEHIAGLSGGMDSFSVVAIVQDEQEGVQDNE